MELSRKKSFILGQRRRCQKVKDTSLNRSGSVEGQKVKNILLDTGCSRTMVKKRWVPQERMLEGKMVSVRCAHGDTELYPLADIRMKVDGTPIRVEAAWRIFYLLMSYWGRMLSS